ncbi:MAG: TetR/AcrR family transcriptional regulator [Proteobacteria bacterium]|nr:TetR/AcrR family transcriptional regulator [Pseudomonadota bacterium]
MSRKPGRPRSFEADTVLRAAMRCFWRKGYSGTSLDDLVAATGLNRPSLYNAFGDKRAVYLAALQAYITGSSLGVRGTLAGKAPLRDELTQLFARAIQTFTGGPGGGQGCFVIGTAIVEAEEDQPTREAVLSLFQGLDRDLIARFRAAATEELPLGGDAESLGRMSVAMLHSLSVRARSGMGPEMLSMIAAGAVDMLAPAKRREA